MAADNKQTQVVQQSQQRKVKGIADIVFVLDRSGSMAPCIQAVRDHIIEFVTALGYDQRVTTVDWRLGFVAFDDSEFYVLQFTNDVEKFKSALMNISTGGSEFTLPALDVALDFPWRDEAQRVLILFTDEPLSGGSMIDYQLSKFQDLMAKIVNLSVKLYYYGEDCPHYTEFQKLPGSYVQVVDLHSQAMGVSDFAKALEQIGRTISTSLTRRAERMKKVQKDLYDVNRYVEVHNL
jgi:hypothetical protein